ncbi:hypothetical protein LCGC14_0566120, partial [marine sediment metagenome]
NSLISNSIYSNTDPLDHVSWEVREDDIFAAVKHVLVEDDIIINNPITYITFSTLNVSNLYDGQIGVENFVHMKQVFYYNTSGEEDVQQLLSEHDYDIDEEGIITFPEASVIHNLYQNSTDVKDNLIYFEYYYAGEINEHLLLPNADGFFINFTMPSIYYDHTTIERLVISFNDVLGNLFSVILYDIDLREYFLPSEKDNYEETIFGLGQMMVIPLYISFDDIQISNLNHKFELKLLESISFTVSDSERWPGSFIQDVGNFTVLNLPYQRIGIKDLRLYNLISDSIDVDGNGYVNSTIEFRSPDYYNFYASDIFKIKRLNIEFTDLKVFSNKNEIAPQSTVNVEYSDIIELNYRWNNSLDRVLLNEIYQLPITLNDTSSNEIISLGLSHWITKIDYDSLSGYLTKYYYSEFEVPKILDVFNVGFNSLGTPIFNISFVDAPSFTLNVTQESLLLNNQIYLSNDDFELEYGNTLLLEGTIRDNDEYIIEDEVYNYFYQEALDGETVHHLDFISPLEDDTFIDKEEFAIYYVDNNLEKIPLYSTLNGRYYRDSTILKYNTDPQISYIDNAFLLNIFWEKNASNFINYDTILLISYKILKGRPISPLSYSTTDSFGNNKHTNLLEIPFARYDMLSRDWVTEDDFIERFLVDKKLLYKDVQSTDATIQGPQFEESQTIQTGIINLGYVEVNKSSSNKFTLVNSSEYSWSINQNGELIVSSLDYSSGDVFRIWYLTYRPTRISHPLNNSISQISYLTIKNQTGYEFNLTLNQDYTLSDDGYSIYFFDLYNLILKSGNFTIMDSFEMKYHAHLSRMVDLSSNILLLLQDSNGNEIPIDTVKINSLGFFEYSKPLRLKEPYELKTSLSLPLGGGKRLVHTALSYLPTKIYNKSSDQFVVLDYISENGDYIYPYKESNKWVKPFTVTTIPNRVKLEVVQDITQDIVINQDFIKEREYLFNLNPAEMIESGEEYTRVMIDALVKEEYEITFKLLEFDSETDTGTPVNNSIIWLHMGLMPKSKSQFINDRAILDEYGISPYFESLGTEEITFKGPGTGANKMYGRPLTYELNNYQANFSAYGPITWTYDITNEFGEVSFNMTFDKEYLSMFSDIFGSIEEITSIEDISLYIRAFSSYFDWDDFAIDTPNQYLSSKDGLVYDGSNKIENYDFTKLSLQDSTYVEGVINLHKKPIAIASNDYLSYTLPDGEIKTEFDPITVHLSGREADIIPTGEFQTVETLTKSYESSEIEPTQISIFNLESAPDIGQGIPDSGYDVTINFVNPSGVVINTFTRDIQIAGDNGYFTVDSTTVEALMAELMEGTEAGPGISSLQIRIDESTYYKASAPLSFPIEIKAANWLKFGEKNTEIDLLDPFINAYGSVFNGDDGTEIAPFESSFPHLIGTIWVEPDFLGEVDDKERSIQDYVEINLIASVLDQQEAITDLNEGTLTNFPLRESIMLRPGNRDGFLKLDVGLGPEDAFLMDDIARLNLSFSINYNADDIYRDDRDVTIYILDLRIESNPSSSNPNTIWSLYEDQTTSGVSNLEINKWRTFDDTQNSDITLGGTVNDETYGVNYDHIYESGTSQYGIEVDSELLTLFNLGTIEPIKVIGRQGGFDHEFTDWSTFPSPQTLSEQSIVQFNTDTPDPDTEFTIIYKFTFNFNSKFYGKIELGPNFDELNESWISFDLEDGLLSRAINNESFMFTRYNQTFIGDGTTTDFTLDYTIQNVPTFNDSYFIIYNEEDLGTIIDRTIVGGFPQITFETAPTLDIPFDVVYGVRSQYEIGYGFQKKDKQFSDSVRLIQNHDEGSEIYPISDGTDTFPTITLADPSLYINLDNAPTRTILELYEIPFLYAPEINLSIKFDPIIVNQIKNLPTEKNLLSIMFDFVLPEHDVYFTDTLEIALDYTAITPDLVSDTYTVAYTKDLQGIYDTYGSTSLDIYISISQISNDSYIPYIILEQFDYLCDTHLLEMYSEMPVDNDNNLNVTAVISTPHYNQIFSRPFIDGTQYGDSPFGLKDGAEITVGLKGLPHSKLVSLEGTFGSYTFNDLGDSETLPINNANFYMIPNLGLFTEGYNSDEPIYQDGFVNLYYGSGTEVDGEQYHSDDISMVHENPLQPVSDYKSWITDGIPDSWENTFTITDQFLSTQSIDVSGTVLYHELFDLTTDILSKIELEEILGTISRAQFAVRLNDSIYVDQIRTVGSPYEYKLSVQGFPIGDYVDGDYCKVQTSWQTPDFDSRPETSIAEEVTDYTLEFAPNNSAYIVFYQLSGDINTNYSVGNKIMVDYWANHRFTEGFDYNIIEDPVNPFESILVWDYQINSIDSYTMHPDFSIDSTFNLEYATLDWSIVDASYINDGQDVFTFRPTTLANISVLYFNEAPENLENFSIYGVIPNDQFDDTSVFKDIYVEIWEGTDESTIKTYKVQEDPILYSYIYQDLVESDHYLLDYTAIDVEIKAREGANWGLVPDSLVFIEVSPISDQLRYPIEHTPFNYDYLEAGNNAYHITLTIEGMSPIYSYDTAEFNKYVSRIENNFIYFNDNNYSEDGYIANQTQITLDYKYKLQPGLIDQEHMLMAIYPWSNVFDNILQSGDGSISYRERYRKLSGSSIISPFEYSLSIDETYSLFLSYRLNRREYFEERFEIDYSTTDYTFDYLPDGLDSYITEFDGSISSVYYYNKAGEATELNSLLYTATNHKITLFDKRVIQSGIHPNIQLRTIQNPITEENEISEFYVSFFAQPYDSSFASHKFSYKTDDLEETLNVNYWSVLGGESLDVMPNFGAYYYNNLDESTFDESINHATQISAYLEEGDTLSFDIAGELSWYDSDLLQDIRDGDKYLALYMNTAFDNFESLDKIKVELNDSTNVIDFFYISAEELDEYDFTLKIDLPTTPNSLETIRLTPFFRTDLEYSTDNLIGKTQFDFVEWDSTKTSYNSDGTKVMYYTLENPIHITELSNYEIAYLFNDELEYLSQPEDIELAWSDETLTEGLEIHILQIPELYIDPDIPSIDSRFKDGDTFYVKYNSPVERTIQLGVEKLYFQKKPFNYDTFPEIAEIRLINTNNTLDYDQFILPYSYNILIPTTPFHTEYLGDYRELTVDINPNLIDSEYIVDGRVDFSDIVISVPNPAFELTIEEINIIQETTDTFPHDSVFSDYIWRNTEKEILFSGVDPSSDSEVYQLNLANEPLFYNDIDEDKWLEYLTIYDEHGNYYSAGSQGDQYTLLWDSITGDFTWNEAFNQYQDIWGIETELPMIIEPETKLYFEYSAATSWSEPFNLDYENLDAGTVEVDYDNHFPLDPRYYTVNGFTFENQEYDYELEQFYSESFTVYSSSANYELTFDIDYDMLTDFTNLALYKVVALYPDYTQFIIVDDDTNYDIIYNPAGKTIEIIDLIPGDGLLDQFDSITVILNFTSGPVSTLTQLSLSNNFNQTYITDPEDTFDGIMNIWFDYFEDSGYYLFSEDYSTITTDATSFKSISFTNNPHLGNSLILKGYNEYELYLNYEISENKFDTIYVADMDQDGHVDYKRETDIDKDGTIDIIKYGVQDSENFQNIIWYKIIQNTIDISKMIEKKSETTETEWFELRGFDPVLEVELKKQGYKGWLLLKGKRIIDKNTITIIHEYSYSYSIKFDYDLDGYSDAQIEYNKVENVVYYNVDVITKTIIFNGSDYDNYDPNDWLSQLYIQDAHLESTTKSFTEELIYYDLEEGDILETRHYTDGFINNDESLFDTGEALSITNTESGEQMKISPDALMFNISHTNWNTETWSVDNVPIKFDTVKVKKSGEDDAVSNIYDAKIIINIPGRNSLYYDFLKDSPLDERYPNTKFVVEGVLITPDAGVYVTSDKDVYLTSSDHKEARLSNEDGVGEGSYLYYDSDSNGFYETVYILSPDNNGDGVYNVIGIGYNYHGSHDFVPYDTIPTNTEEFGTIATAQSSDITFDTSDSKILDIYQKENIDRVYPHDVTDGIIAMTHIFDISQLVIDSEAGKLYPGLYDDVKKQRYANVFNSYKNNLWIEVRIEVSKSLVAGIASAVVSSLYSTWLAPFVFAGLYFLMSLDRGDPAFLAEQQVKGRTFYSEGSDFTNPPSLNEKSITVIDREGMEAVTNQHAGAYYTTVFGGEPGDIYEASVISSPPSIWRYAEIEAAGSHYGWLFVDSPTGPQYVRKTYDLGLEGEYIDPVPQFTDFNLDYFLITSELPALEDTLNKRYSPTKNVFRVELYMDSANVYDPHSIPHAGELNIDSASRLDLYDAYKENTIGYLEQEVELQSEGQFDSIRPLVINGISQYVFVDSHDELVSRTSPLSPLYSPIIVGQTRYDELISQGKYRNSIISVQADCAYGTENDVFNVYQLHPSEVMEGYSAKIPLSPTEFNYPITSITIEVKEQLGIIVKTVDVNAEDYTIVDGNLFFTKTLEEIVFEDKAEWQSLSSKKVARRVIRWIDGVRRISTRYVFQTIDLNYNIKISFATVVPYSDSFNLDADPYAAVPSLNIPDFNIFLAGMDYAGYHQGAPLDLLDINSNVASYGLIGDAPVPQDIIDTTSNEQARLVLAQATSYTMLDYFNQVQMGFEDAEGLAERDYTVLVTFWSTLISTLVMLPVTVAGMLYKTPVAALGGLSVSKALAQSLLRIPLGISSEIFEELYIDPMIEEAISGMVRELGGDEETASLWSLFATSFREAFTGGITGQLNLIRDANVETHLSIIHNIGKLAGFRYSKMPSITLKGVTKFLMATASLFFGGADIFVMSVGLDIATDKISEKLKNYHLKGTLPTTSVDKAEGMPSTVPVDISAINIAWLFNSEKATIKTTTKVVSETKLFDTSHEIVSITSGLGGVYPSINYMNDNSPGQGSQEDAIERNKANLEEIEKLKMKNSEAKKYLPSGKWNSFEITMIQYALESLRNQQLNGESVLFKNSISGGIKKHIFEAVQQKSRDGDVLTELESTILLTDPRSRELVTNKPYYSNIEVGTGIPSPFATILRNFMGDIRLELRMMEVLKSLDTRAELDNILFYDRKEINTIAAVVAKLENNRFIKSGNIEAHLLDTWLARIEAKIQELPISKKQINQYIDEIRFKFNHYYSISGYLNPNQFYLPAKLLVIKVGEVLARSGIPGISENTIAQINRVFPGPGIGGLYVGLKEKPNQITEIRTIEEYRQRILATFGRYISEGDIAYINEFFKNYKQIVELYNRGKSHLKHIPDSIKKTLLQKLIDASPALQSGDSAFSIYRILIGDPDNADAWMKDVPKGEDPARILIGKYFNIKKRISILSTKSFLAEGIVIHLQTMKKFQRDATKIVDTFIKKHFMNKKLSGLIGDLQYEMTYKVWLAYSTYYQDPNIPINRVGLGGYYSLEHGRKLAGNALNELKSKVEILLTSDEFIALDDVLSDIVNSFGFSTKPQNPVYYKSIRNDKSNLEIYQEAINAIEQYATYRNIDLNKVGKSKYYTNEPIISDRGLSFLPSIPKYTKLRNELLNIRANHLSDPDIYQHIRADSTRFSSLNRLVYNQDLKKQPIPLSQTEFERIRKAFFTILIDKGIISEWKAGDRGAPHVVQKLLEYADGLGTNQHQDFVRKLHNAVDIVLLGTELTLSITVDGDDFAGQLDGLIYDYEYDSRFMELYVFDFKPQYQVGNRLAQSYAMAIPQVSGYTLTLQEKVNIKMKSIILSKDGAIMFDPNIVLPLFNKFMSIVIDNRENPFEALAKLIRP